MKEQRLAAEYEDIDGLMDYVESKEKRAVLDALERVQQASWNKISDTKALMGALKEIEKIRAEIDKNSEKQA